MSEQQVTIWINHKGERKSFSLRKGLGFQALAAKEACPIEFDCRKADCGICIIKILQGMEHLSECIDPEKDFLRAMHADDNERLACQTRILGDIEIEVESF